ncbi:MAG: ABC transporter substrate-binding protein [Ilumatobacteraceae bacterium]
MKRAAAAIVIAALAVTSCGSDDSSDATDDTASPAVETDAPGDSEPVATEPAGTAPIDTAAQATPDDTTASTPVDTTAPDAPAVEFPLTIEHRYGSTTLDAPPQTIVSLDTQWTDVLVALDAPLAAAALDPSVEGGVFPWQEGVPADVERIPVTNTIPYEAIAALQPDLIVITYYATSEADYELLSAIAPTIPLLGDEEVDTWQAIAEVAGQIVGDPQAATDLIADAEQLSADVLAELPGLEGKTYALANYVPGDAIYVVADPDDGASAFFSQIGMTIDPDLLAIADGASGRVTLSLEQIGLLDADMLVLLTNGADPADIPGYDQLPAVQSGAVAILDIPDVSGLNTPTPLSVPYSLERIRAALEAVAGS